MILFLLPVMLLAAEAPVKRCEELTDENFDQKMVEEGPLFVKFYLPTCKHCQELAPIWALQRKYRMPH